MRTAPDIRISGQTSRLKLSPRACTHLGNLPLLSVFDRLKSVMDRSLAALLIVLPSTLFLTTALAVRLDSKGPVVFRQRPLRFQP